MGNHTIEPFRIDIPSGDVAELRARLAAARWPTELPDVGWAYGIPAARLRPLVERWRELDWQRQQADLNRFDQYVTEIDGRRLHFSHVRSPEPDALPLVLVHGWPFSDFRTLIEPLTDPRASGGDPAQAFDLVIPTLPGFGFSGPTRRTGDADSDQSAELIKQLMARLGYRRYGAHGGDAGGFIAPQLGRIAPDRVVGVHLNGPITIPSRDEDGNDFDERDRRMLATKLGDWSGRDTSSYAAIHSTRPQTLAYGLNDSPIGLLAWIADVLHSYAREPIDDDVLLTNISIGWFTGTIGSSFLLYKESGQWGEQPESSGVPTAIAIFPGDSSIRAIAERQHNVQRWTTYDRGGHFPALEAPDLLIKDLREFFDTVR